MNVYRLVFAPGRPELATATGCSYYTNKTAAMDTLHKEIARLRKDGWTWNATIKDDGQEHHFNKDGEAVFLAMEILPVGKWY